MLYGMQLYVVVEARDLEDARQQQARLQQQLKNPMLSMLLQNSGVAYRAADMPAEPYALPPQAAAALGGR